MEHNKLPRVISCGDTVLYAPAYGRVASYRRIPDPIFSQGLLGKGIAVEPESGEVYAPCDGVVNFIADEKHAIGFLGPGGMQLMLHIGINTVAMGGDGFELFVRDGEHFARGQRLAVFDREKVRRAGYLDTVILLLMNSESFDHLVLYSEADQ